MGAAAGNIARSGLRAASGPTFLDPPVEVDAATLCSSYGSLCEKRGQGDRRAAFERALDKLPRRARSAEDRDAGAERHARGRNGLPRSVAARSNADGARATSSVLPVATLALRSQGAEGRSRGGRCKVFMKCQGCSTAGVCSKWPHNVRFSVFSYT